MKGVVQNQSSSPTQSSFPVITCHKGNQSFAIDNSPNSYHHVVLDSRKLEAQGLESTQRLCFILLTKRQH